MSKVCKVKELKAKKKPLNFPVIFCTCVEKLNLILHPGWMEDSLTTRHTRVTKKIVFRYLLFVVIFIVVYSPTLAPILIYLAYAVHTHTQFKMNGKQSYENDCSS